MEWSTYNLQHLYIIIRSHANTNINAGQWTYIFTLQSYKNGIETLAWLKLTVTCFSNSNW